MFAWRVPALRSGAMFAPLARRRHHAQQSVSHCSAATVFVGTLYPLVLEAITGDKITVGGPFFNVTVVWFFLLLLLAVPFGMFLAWKRGDLREAAHKLWPAAVLALIAGLGQLRLRRA